MTLTASITVFATDIAVSRSFYEGILGLTVLEVTDDGFTARRGDLVVTVEGGAIARKRGRRWMQEAGLYLTIRTDDFDGLHGDLVKRGATFLGEVAMDGTGKRFSGLHDPDGVLIEIAEA
jgi:catechol 2,3-dioxygenase-like lactoylglutathione lyase family enzyme